MKKKSIQLTFAVIVVICITSVVFIGKDYTHMRNEQYEYHGEYYSPSSGPYGWNWNRNMSGYIFWYIWQSYFFKKR